MSLTLIFIYLYTAWIQFCKVAYVSALRSYSLMFKSFALRNIWISPICFYVVVRIQYVELLDSILLVHIPENQKEWNPDAITLDNFSTQKDHFNLLKLFTVWKVSILGLIFVCIFMHSDRIQTRITRNTDTFYAVIHVITNANLKYYSYSKATK